MIKVQSGVPQVSHLSTILFTLFINYLPPVVLHSKVLIYADDVKIFNTFNNVYGSDQLQADFCNFYNWCKLYLLELNIKKIDTLLKLLDHRLNVRDNISMNVNKAFRTLGYMKCWCKEFVKPYLTKMLFISLVRPILEYCLYQFT